MRLSVLGTGYLGATHAACMADLGHDVVGVDVDPVKVDALNAGVVPFHEPGLDDVLARALTSGRLRFTTHAAEAAQHAQVHFLCVGTPQLPESGAADVAQLDAAVAALAPHLTAPCLVVGKSTVPVGTAHRLAEELARLAPAGEGVDLAWNPEFLREGFAVRDTVKPDRIVLGVRSHAAEQTLREVYADAIGAGTPVVVTDLPTAELVKTAANAFLATKISFINAMAELCEATGADVATLADAIGRDERIGHRFLRAGLGFGGGCLPKDIRAFRARATELGAGAALDFLDDVDAVNQRCRTRAAAAAAELLGGRISGARIAALGAAFKPDSDDVRDSPALDVIADLVERGADVVVHDPAAGGRVASAVPGATVADEVESALDGADLVVLLTEWDDYRRLDPAKAAGLATGRLLLDTRDAVDRAAWVAAGWTVRTLGRPTVGPSTHSS